MQIDTREQLHEIELAGLQTVADLFGVSRDTAKRWAGRGMPGESAPGKPTVFNLAEVVQWRLRHEATSSGSNSAAGDEAREERTALEIRKLRAQVEVLEKQAGRLVDRDEVGREVERVIATLRRTLQRLPARLSPQLPEEIRADLVPQLERQVGRVLDLAADELLATIPEEPEP